MLVYDKIRVKIQSFNPPSALNPGIAFKMALKPNLSFSSCDNPMLGIMNVDIRIKMTAALNAIAVRLTESLCPMEIYY
jgi:hypothetical protein